ncbi:hypothetical protein DAC16_89 [Bacteroides phage DAC16]|nr:hypothetical protein DAC16_89 [Bacteroides phage DAC16]QIG64366.1 hypothetical protein DAC23_88 [Bacteroides phage DAC23]
MAVLKDNKMVNLSLKELVTEMRETIHNNERFCFSDTIIDIESILEEMENYGGYSFTLYWGVRKNGTTMKKVLSQIDTNYFKEIYKITFNNGKFSKERI